VTNVDEAATASGDSGDRPGDKSRKKSAKKAMPLWQETILLLVLALLLAIIIKSLFVQAFYIPSPSMEPQFVKNDRILVQKVSYWFGGTPQRGDVVVFEDPGDWLSDSESAGPTNPVTSLMARIGLYPTGGHLVKRVIGVEGDTITCCDKLGRISVNGTPLNEKSYAKLDGADCYGPMTSTCHWSAGPVPEDHVFVMGDNRHNSADSTVHMCPEKATDCVSGDEFVPQDLVVGRVFVLLWPSSRFSWLHRPATFADVPDPS
jgi:signal peptidase I